jgi:E3 ubiquitin-protein ligase DOA10
MDEKASCRFCFVDENPDDLIVPCKCIGSSRVVHRACLDNWRSTDVSGKNFKTCNVCHFDYILEKDPILDDTKRLTSFVYQTCVDLFFWLFITIAVVFTGIVLLKLIDSYRIIPMILRVGWDELSYCLFTIILLGMGWSLINKEFVVNHINPNSFNTVTSLMANSLVYTLYRSHQHVMKTMDDNHKRIFLKKEAELHRVKDFSNTPNNELPWNITVQ